MWQTYSRQYATYFLHLFNRELIPGVFYLQRSPTIQSRRWENGRLFVSYTDCVLLSLTKFYVDLKTKSN